MRTVVLLLLCHFAMATAADITVYRGATLYPVSGPMIENAILVIEDDKIRGVGGQDLSVPRDASVVDVTGKVIIPGMVDTHSHLGRPRGGDRSDPLAPDARSLDSIDIHSKSFWRARSGGITTINVMPGSGLLMSGQTTYLKIRHNPRRIEDWLFCEDPVTEVCGGMKMANGTNSIRDKPFPGTRSRSAALQRFLFVQAENYRNKVQQAEDNDKPPPARDLRMEATLEVLDGDRRIQFHSHRHNDIMTVIRLANEFQLDPVIQHGTDAWKVADELAAAGLHVSLTLLESPGGKEEVMGLNMKAPLILHEAGVDISINTDDYVLDSRLFLRYGALAIRYGLPEAVALEALTLAAARALELEDRVGSLEPGKDADFVVLSGPPFSTYTRVEQTWVEGRKVYDASDPEHRKFATGGHDTYDASYVHVHEEAVQ